MNALLILPGLLKAATGGFFDGSPRFAPVRYRDRVSPCSGLFDISFVRWGLATNYPAPFLFHFSGYGSLITLAAAAQRPMGRAGCFFLDGGLITHFGPPTCQATTIRRNSLATEVFHRTCIRPMLNVPRRTYRDSLLRRRKFAVLLLTISYRRLEHFLILDRPVNSDRVTVNHRRPASGRRLRPADISIAGEG